MARSHWRHESAAPADYPYEVDAPFVRDERPAMVLAEQQYMRDFVDPYTLYTKRAQRDRRYLRLSDAFQFDTAESEMRLQSEAIQRHLTQLQNPQHCDASHRYVLFSFATYQSYGFGAAVRHLAMAFDYAISRRRILVVQEVDEFSYADTEQTPLSAADVAALRSSAPSAFGFVADAASAAAHDTDDGRCGGGWLCYFETPSKCTRDMLLQERLPMRAQILFEQSRYEPVALYSSRGRTYDEVLLQLGDDRLHDLYWHAQLMRFLFKPVAALRARLAQWRAPPVAVHMRQGDKSGELAGRQLTAWLYHDAIVGVRGEHGDVFVASDGAAALEELKRAGASRNEYRVVHLEEERHNDAMQLLLRQHSVNRKREAVAAIGNIWLLAQSETLIGYTWSKFCALAFELQYARDRHSTELIDVLNGTWTPF